MRRPPHLVVGGGDDLPDEDAGHGAADGRMQVRGESFLGFDGGEVLHWPAAGAAQVLPEPVDQLAEVDRVAGGAAVVVVPWVQWCSVGPNLAVGGHGQGDEKGGPKRLAVRCVEGATERGRG